MDPVRAGQHRALMAHVLILVVIDIVLWFAMSSIDANWANAIGFVLTSIVGFTVGISVGIDVMMKGPDPR